MKKIFLIVAILFGLGVLMQAQTVIRNESFKTDEENVTVSFEVETDVKGLPSRRKEVITPYIYNGKDTLFFDKLEVYGKGRYKRERQVNHINGDKDWELGDNQTLKGKVYNYEARVPLKRWMKSANLGIRRQLVGCACEKDLTDENVAESLALFDEPQAPARRMPEYVLQDATSAWDFGEDRLEIIFKVSKTLIDSTVFDNEIVFGKILSAIDRIKSDPNCKIDKIEVAGYASPEGPPKFNKMLGDGRAKALINYIIEHRPQYNLTMDDFCIVNGEENWEGVKVHVEESDLKYKDKVLEIINNKNYSNELKKLKIEKIDYGWTWKKMRKEIYPYLRSARYLALHYNSADDKAVEIINKANSMIREGKYKEAAEYLDPVKDDMRAYNSIGVTLMMQGRFEEAMIWFEKAVEGNSQLAQKNIDAIKAEYEYEAQQQKIIEEYLKKYE